MRNWVNFKLLNMFVAVAENCSFKLAAEQLHRSQSAVSMQIKSLEEQIGVPLFHRSTRKVELTREGAELLIFAQRALGEWQVGLQQIREAADMQRGTLAVGCVPTIAVSLLPEILKRFVGAHQAITVNVHEFATEELCERIRRREIDMAIGPDVGSAGEFQFEPIIEEQILAIGAPALMAGVGPEITLAELCRLPLIRGGKAAALSTELERALALADLKLNVRFEVQHFQTMLAFAKAELGVVVLPETTMMDHDPALVAVPVVAPRLKRSLGILMLRQQALSPAARVLSAIIGDVLRGAVAASGQAATIATF